MKLNFSRSWYPTHYIGEWEVVYRPRPGLSIEEEGLPLYLHIPCYKEFIKPSKLLTKPKCYFCGAILPKSYIMLSKLQRFNDTDNSVGPDSLIITLLANHTEHYTYYHLPKYVQAIEGTDNINMRGTR